MALKKQFGFVRFMASPPGGSSMVVSFGSLAPEGWSNISHIFIFL